MSEVSSIVCTFLCNVQIIYIHAYTIFFLFFSCILLINQTHTHRPLVKLEIVEWSRPKVSDSGSRSPERSLSGNLNTNSFSMTSPSTTSDSASHLLYRFESPSESVFSDPYPPIFLSLSLSLCLSLSLYLCQCLCVSLFLFLLFLCFFVHVSSKFYLSLALSIHTQNKYNQYLSWTTVLESKGPNHKQILYDKIYIYFQTAWILEIFKQKTSCQTYLVI